MLVALAAGALGPAVALHPAVTDDGPVLADGRFWIDIGRVVSNVSRTVNDDQPFTTADLVGDTGLDPMTSTV
jgi:hypothetical protein